MKKLCTTVILVLAGLGVQAEETADQGDLKKVRIYTTGNSLTEQTIFLAGPKFSRFAAYMKEHKGLDLSITRDHRGGSSLAWRYENVAAPNILKNGEASYACEVFTLQPYGPYGSEMVAAKKYIDVVAKQNPAAPILLYALYPKKEVFPDFETGWNWPYEMETVGGENARRSAQTRNYFEGFYKELKAYAAQNGYTNPIRMIPVGYVMEKLQRMMKAGEIPGFTDIWQLHKDGVHHNALGGWMDSLAFYAVIFQEDPKDLPMNIMDRREFEAMVTINGPITGFKQIEDAEKIIKRVVWETVAQMHDVTGVPVKP